MDGILPLWTRRIGPGEIEIYGLCILISDQTLTPLDVRLQLVPSDDSISWLECRLGERNGLEMVRVPYGEHTKLFARLEGRRDSIDWVYRAGLGDRLIS